MCCSQKMHFKCENPWTSSHQYVKSLTSTHYHIQVNIKTNYINCIKTVYKCIKTKVIPLKTMKRYFVIFTIFEILQKLGKNVKLVNDKVIMITAWSNH